MLNFEFQAPRSTLVGAGASGRLGELAGKLGCQSLLLMTDKGVEAAGLLESALAALKKAGMAVQVYSDVQADPPEA
ncbi:iron-containing alcohol dehydrogenase, partial [Noviherbaspirillum denitrificans]|uniref:iron-containing alcohol dehydrogenase n=1 Tax=Noviherbaspirillum denitrificans TaxID=1968433 RepID=UPI00112FE6DB